jgi:hypothetical protein
LGNLWIVLVLLSLALISVFLIPFGDDLHNST